MQAFEKLSKGLAAMSDTAAGFGSKIIAGLLRSAPDLKQYIKNVRSMYKVSEGKYIFLDTRVVTESRH
jgi:DNA mismatch repair protein MSH6